MHPNLVLTIFSYPNPGLYFKKMWNIQYYSYQRKKYPIKLSKTYFYSLNNSVNYINFNIIDDMHHLNYFKVISMDNDIILILIMTCKG